MSQQDDVAPKAENKLLGLIRRYRIGIAALLLLGLGGAWYITAACPKDPSCQKNYRYNPAIRKCVKC